MQISISLNACDMHHDLRETAQKMFKDKKTALVIPALNESQGVKKVILNTPDYVDSIIVADNGSEDNTAETAASLGAEVVSAYPRGYGSACLAALEHLKKDPPDIVVFANGDASENLSQMDSLLTPLASGRLDLVIGSRKKGSVEKGALSLVQRFGNMLACFLIYLIWGKRFMDLGPFRAITWEALEGLSMKDPDFGWTVEMQIKAARMGLRTKEVPVDYLKRRSGVSKISGTIKGTVMAGSKILWWIFKEALRDRKYLSFGAVSYSAAVLLVLAHIFNRKIFEVGNRPIYLSDFLVFLLVFAFGVYRFSLKDDTYQKVRIHVIVWLYLIFWGIMPYVMGITVPGLDGGRSMWPAIHVIGSAMFFIYGFLMLFFGRRLDCGWNCPCVATRETVGFAFRRMTPNNRLWWKLRYIKYIFLAFLFVYLGWLIFDPVHAYEKVGAYYYTVLTESYYFSYLFLPLFGNRSYCRIVCPYAALWGLYSYMGFYRIEAHGDNCLGCGKCESVCDMGIPIREFVKKGRIKTVECMGCGRCVNVCPAGILKIKSAWEFIRPVINRSKTMLRQA